MCLKEKKCFQPGRKITSVYIFGGKKFNKGEILMIVFLFMNWFIIITLVYTESHFRRDGRWEMKMRWRNEADNIYLIFLYFLAFSDILCYFIKVSVIIFVHCKNSTLLFGNTFINFLRWLLQMEMKSLDIVALPPFWLELGVWRGKKLQIKKTKI
jgi:hypothetical protein